MTEELDVLLDISRRLDLVEIPHMVTGSIAMSLYVRPRMTRDIDVVVVLQTGDVDRLVTSLEDSYYIDTGAARRAVLQPGMFNAIHEELIIKVDLIPRPDTEYALHAFERRQFIDIIGRRVPVISPEDLVLAKLNWAEASHSETQIQDVKALLEYEGLDMTYIANWVQVLGLQCTWRRVQC